MERKFDPNATPKVVDGSIASARTVYVDGNVGAAFGPFLTKVHFHEVVGIENDGGELRKVVLNLVIPTPVLIEFCKNTLNAFTANSVQLTEAIAQQNDSLQKVLQK